MPYKSMHNLLALYPKVYVPTMLRHLTALGNQKLEQVHLDISNKNRLGANPILQSMASFLL